jgi:hypothetical protein
MKDGNTTILYSKETRTQVLWLTGITRIKSDLRDPSRDLHGHVREGRSRLSNRDPSSRL